MPSVRQAPFAVRFGPKQAQVAVFATKLPTAHLIDNGFDFELLDELRFLSAKSESL